MGNLAFAELLDLVVGCRLAFAKLDPRHDLFAVLRTRHTNNLGIGHRWMAVEELFDLTGIHVFATPNNHVLDPSNNVDVPVVIHDSQIA